MGASAPNQRRPARVPSKVGDFVARELVNSIVRDQLAPETLLPNDTELARRYGVGRASVREGLRILESFGVVRLKTGPGGGPIVAQTDGRAFAQVAMLFLQLRGATVDDVIQVRIAVEPVIARLAATGADEQKRTLLAGLVRQLGDEDDSNPLSQYFHGLDFHHLLVTLPRNPLIELFGEALNEVVRRVSPFEPRYEREHVHREHLAIVEAIAQGNPDAAAEATETHLQQVREFLRRTQPEVLTRPITWS